MDARGTARRPHSNSLRTVWTGPWGDHGEVHVGRARPAEMDVEPCAKKAPPPFGWVRSRPVEVGWSS